MSDQGLDALPRPVPEILLEIIQAGLLNIRSAGWGGHSRRCALEADHIHNLPGLVRELRVGGLRYYLEVERSDFIRQSTSSTAIFTELWRELDASAGLTLED